jgi:hypothetical protein
MIQISDPLRVLHFRLAHFCEPIKLRASVAVPDAKDHVPAGGVDSAARGLFLLH